LLGVVLGVVGLGAAEAGACRRAPTQIAAMQLTSVAAPTAVAARRGVIAYSDYDPALRVSFLTIRGSTGVVRRLPVAPQAGGFTVTLGTDARGRLIAIYPRCPPHGARARCRLYVTRIADGVERAVRGGQGGQLGVSEHGHLVMVRETRGAERLVSGTLDGALAVRLPLPRLFDYYAEGKPRRLPPSDLKITSMTIRGRDVAYVLEYNLPVAPIAASEVWMNHGQRPPRLLAHIGTGGAASGFRTFFAPRLTGRYLDVYQQGGCEFYNEVQRRTLTGRLVAHAGIGHVNANSQELTSAAFDGNRLVFSLQRQSPDGCTPYGRKPIQRCAIWESRTLRFTPTTAHREQTPGG